MANKLFIFLILTLSFLVLSCAGVSKNITPESPEPSPSDEWLAQAAPVVDDTEGALNPYVLKIIDSYPLDGSYPYRWEKDEYDIYNGVSQNLLYNNKILAKAHPNGTRCSNCCGLTFEIFFRAMQLRNTQKGLDPDSFNGLTFEDLFNAMLIWFVVGPGDSPAEAIEYYGWGNKIEDWEEARAGDFCDISRSTGSGHSVIFINWTRDDKNYITGLKYFSSNSAGVGYLTEYFNDSGGKVLRKYVHLGRVGTIEDYKPFNRSEIPDRINYAP